jgi:16S rRNA (uracil1498-N3)-methyltransferase
MNIFYNPDIQGDTVQLEEQESKHAIRVLRLKKGDAVSLVDGEGGWYEAEVEDEHPKRCRLKINSRIPDHPPLPYHLHLAISPTKSMERFEWFLEKATEIGISEITPLICHRTERTRINRDRMERILISAMKQSLRAYKPVLHDPVPLVKFISEKRDGIQGIAHCIQEGEGTQFERVGLTALLHGTSYTILVGPEGDFTEEEVNMALEKGFKPFHLGEPRLRTETAGVYICAAISYSTTF